MHAENPHSEGHKTGEEDCIRACMEGRDASGEAFSALYLRHQRDLLSFIMKRFRFQEAEAEDIVQETFLLAQGKISSLKSEKAFKTWLYQIAISQSLNRFRGCYTGQVSLGESHTSELRSREPEPEEYLMQDEVIHAVRNAIANINPDFAEAITHVDLWDEKYDDAAEALHMPSGTVKTRRMRGILALEKSEALRKLLGQSC